MSIRICQVEGCPYPNAATDRAYCAYCGTTPLADVAVGHELGAAVLPPSVLAPCDPWRTSKARMIYGPGWGRGLADGQLHEDSPSRWILLSEAPAAVAGTSLRWSVWKVTPADFHAARWVCA